MVWHLSVVASHTCKQITQPMLIYLLLSCRVLSWQKWLVVWWPLSQSPYLLSPVLNLPTMNMGKLHFLELAGLHYFNNLPWKGQSLKACCVLEEHFCIPIFTRVYFFSEHLCTSQNLCSMDLVRSRQKRIGRVSIPELLPLLGAVQPVPDLYNCTTREIFIDFALDAQ